MPFSTSSIRTSLPNSLGLCALPLRITSVWGSNRLNTLPSTWLSPPNTRFLVCWITFSTKGRKYRSWPICLSTSRPLPATCSRPFPHRCSTWLAFSHHAPSQAYQLLVTVPHSLLVGLGQGLGGAANFQQTMFHREGLVRRRGD